MVERTKEIKKITNDFYNNFALQYQAQHSKSPVQSMHKFVNLLVESKVFGFIPTILDLGCGGGRNALLFQSFGFKPICVDLSLAMCRAAREKGLPTVQMDQENLAFKPESFDGVWSRVSLLHSPPEIVPGILADLRLILKPGGVLFLSMKASIGQYIETELKTTENGSTYYCYWPSYRLHSLLETLGFEVGELSIHGKDSFNERNYFELYATKE